jgi:hypothetical protein
MLSGVNYCRGVEDLSTLRGWAEVIIEASFDLALIHPWFKGDPFNEPP